MTIPFLAQRRRHLRAIGQRCLDEHRALATAIGRLLLQQATARGETGDRLIPNRRSTRDGIIAAIYAQVLKPYYIGSGEEPFAGVRPLSPYARLLYDGVRGLVRIEAERQAVLVRRLATDEVVVDWLLSSARPAWPLQEMSIVSFTQWLDPRGFRLSERIQRVAVEVRSRLARFLDYHIGQGTPAPTMATRVEAFLTTGERGHTPYGQQGSYAARCLVQHEVIKAGGEAVAAEGAINPYVRGAQWLLDPAHPKTDRCDVRASGGADGDGVYPLSDMPIYPDHVNCMCHLRAVPVRNPAAVTATLRRAIDERAPAAEVLRGALNPERATMEVLTGAIQQAANQVQAAPLVVPPAPGSLRSAPMPTPTLPTHQPSDQVRRMATTYIDDGIAKLARERKLTPAEIEAKIASAVAELTQGDLAIRVHTERLEDVLSSGRLKTQFETGTSSGLIGTQTRSTAEYLGMGIPEQIEARLRPVYGYVDLGEATRKATAGYGDLAFVLKGEARSRTGFTVGDSLFNFESGRVASMPITAPSKEAWDNHLRALVEYAETRDLERLLQQVEYIEIQVQNGVRLGDIRAVRDPAGRLTADQRSRLAELGIDLWD